MDFHLTSEQQMLREQVERFGAEHYEPVQLIRRLSTGKHDDSRARWRDMAANGWLALPLAEAHGGLGGSAVDVMVLMEAFGNHLIAEPFASNCVLAASLLAHGEQRAAELLTQLGQGELQIAAASSERDAGFDLHRVAITATADNDGFRLNGAKCHVEHGADADWFIVSARNQGASDARTGISLFLIAKDTPGLHIETYRSIDHHRHARLRLDEVAAPATALLGALGAGLPLLEHAVQRTIAAYLAEAVGCMDCLRDNTLAFLKTRHQFGVAIGTFQALQHRMAEIAIACEEARSLLYHATLHLDADAQTRSRAIAAAKARIGQLSLFVARQCVQLHGGIGVTDELIVSHHLRRLMMIDLAFGKSDYHLAAFACAA